ncbi:fungal-specific transcription factor domain-containing protein [Spinellus fusiger]|nr:fungal-specific transcription factor domain-containing protein [Spinellus fusiger]
MASPLSPKDSPVDTRILTGEEPTTMKSTTESSKKISDISSDRVQYLGDLSSLQFFSSKMQLEGRKFGKQVVLVENSADSIDTTTSLNQPQSKSDIYHWIFSVTGVDRYTCDRLLKIYFANIHLVLPVVDKAKFLRQYRNQEKDFPCADVLNAMLGAAARFVESEAQIQKNNSTTTSSTTTNSKSSEAAWDVPIGWSDQFFDKARSLVSSSASYPNLSKVQAAILIHNHSGNIDSKSSACWIMGGLAQALGLNRNCEEWDISESEKQTRKRLWWSMYITDRFHSASLGRPISIRDEDNDVGYPDATVSWREILDEPEDLEGQNIARFPSATYRPSTIDGRVELYQLFLQLVKLSETLGRILQGLYTPKAQKVSYHHGSDAIVTMLDHELTEWRLAYPKALENSNFRDFNEDGYYAPVSASIRLCYFTLLILLHRPFIERTSFCKSKKKPAYSSFSIGTSAATRGIRIASQMKMRDFLMFPYSFGLYPVLQCCLIHMYNTKNPDPNISALAKADLTLGIQLVDSLQEMSSSARRLHGLLTVIMSNKDISIEPGLETNSNKKDTTTTNANAATATVTATATATATTTTTTTTTDSTSSSTDAISTIEIPGTRVNSHITKPSSMHSPWSSVHSNHPTQSINPSHLQASQTSQHSNSSFTNTRFLSQPLSDNMVTPYETYSTPSPTGTKEAFTLKQFGFTVADNSGQQNDVTQDVPLFSDIDGLPFFLNCSSAYEQPTQSLDIQIPIRPINLLSSDISSMNDDILSGSMSVNSTLTSEQDLSSMVFRNNPNNPFWDIPSSMDWTEWNQWNQRSQGSVTWLPLG